MADPLPRADGSRRRGEQLPPFRGGGDPWSAFGYLVSGVAVYGALGWVLGSWLHAPYLVPVGILFGATLGLYLVFNRFGRRPQDPPTDPPHDPPTTGGTSDSPVGPSRVRRAGRATGATHSRDARGEDAE